MAVLGALAWPCRPRPSSSITFAAYAIALGFASSFMHETHHGTAFRSRWLNEVMHDVAGILTMKEAMRDR